MARNTFESNGWIPEESDSRVLQQVRKVSAVEAYASGVNMSTDVRLVARSANVAVAPIAKGGTYTESEALNDEVTLTARKFGTAIRIAEEDLADSPLQVIQSKQVNWASSYGKLLDNASLGVTAAENGTTVPFTSVYKAIRTSNSDTSYTADANLIQTGGALTYADVSSVFELVEDSDYFDEERLVIIAHPSLRSSLREVQDGASHYVFVDGKGGDGGSPDSLFNVPVHWSLGAKTHGTATSTPTGNALMVVANRDYMLRGDRVNVESMISPADSGAAFLTDETLLKMRARKAFVVGNENAFGVIEITA